MPIVVAGENECTNAAPRNERRKSLAIRNLDYGERFLVRGELAPQTSAAFKRAPLQSAFHPRSLAFLTV